MVSNDVVPISSVSHHAEPKAREFEKSEIDKMLRINIIEPAKLEWTLSIIFSQICTKSQRFCIHYRELSPMAVKDTYPITPLDECFGKLCKSYTLMRSEATSKTENQI